MKIAKIVKIRNCQVTPSSFNYIANLPNVLGSKWHSTIFAIKIQHYSNFQTNTLPFQVKANKIRSWLFVVAVPTGSLTNVYTENP